MEPAAGNIRKLLIELEGESDRTAQFRTVISLVMNGAEYRFEGVVKGEITLESYGVKGFGYDPVFRPDGYHKTFAEMDLSLKNSISHRAIAMNRLSDFLRGM
jgi:XTP/dITP diphosphohydrolase